MPSIFDLLNPQQAALAPGVPRPPSILDSPDYRSDRLGDALAGMAQALVKAGGPSQYPQGFAEAFGAAGSGAVQGTQGSEDKYLKRAMVNAQVQAAEESLRADKAFRDLLNGAGGAPATATAGLPGAAAGPAVPTAVVPGGGPSNPTNPGNLANGQGGFQSFPTPEAGVAAAIKNVQSYPAKYNGGQPMSLIQIGQAWAPKDDGKTPQLRGNDPVVWANNVAKAGGLDPNQPLDFNDPAVALKFAQGVHVAEHGQGKGYAPDVYQRGVSLAMGGPPPPVNPVGPVAAIPPQGDAVPLPAPVQTDGAPPPAATGGPVQLAQAPGGAPPQQAAPAIPGPVAPPPGGPRTLQDVIQTMPPGVRQMVGAMGRKEGMGQILKYADPETHVAIDTTNNQIVFAPKTDKSGRYVPVDVMKLDIERQNAASQAEQARARTANTASEVANRPLTPGATPGAPPTPTPGFVEQKGAAASAEEKAKQEASLDADAAKALVTGAVKEFTDNERPKAKAIQAQIPQIHNVRRAIEAGAITGTGTAVRNTLAQAASTLGFQSNEAAITPSYIAAMGQQLLANAKALGTNPSNFEDRIIREATGANPDTSKEGMLRLLDVQESLLRQAHQRYVTEAERIQSLRGVKSAFGDNYFALPQPPNYEQWSKDNPLPPAATAAPPIRKYNPATGKIE